MSEQLIISVGREFGSGGHEIAQKLANFYKLPLYDHNLLDELAKRHEIEDHDFHELDEKKRSLFARSVRGMHSSAAQNVAELQFNFIREKAASGESFVIVGRCSDEILRGHEGFISVFILGDLDVKTKRIMTLYQKSEKEAVAFLQEKDRKRKLYHNSHCKIKWGDSRGYDLSINSSKMGIDETVKSLTQYIDARRNHNK